MSDTYFELFKKANTLIEQVKVDFFKPLQNGAVYIFKVKNEYTVTLTLRKVDDSRTAIWKRDWTCDCRAGIRNNDEMCSHTLACLVYLTVK